MKKNKGVTLIELLVVIAIISIMSGVMFLSTTTLGNKARVDEAANKIFDIMRETRHNSVSVKEFKANLFPGYGVYFDINTPRTIIVYADCVIDDTNDEYIDENDSFVYDQMNCSGASGLVEKITLNSRVLINEMRLMPSVGAGAGSVNIESKIYMEYIRPEPTMWISDTSGTLLPAGRIEIDLVDISGKFKKTIIFWTTGLFAIK